MKTKLKASIFSVCILLQIYASIILLSYLFNIHTFIFLALGCTASISILLSALFLPLCFTQTIEARPLPPANGTTKTETSASIPYSIRTRTAETPPRLAMLKIFKIIIFAVHLIIFLFAALTGASFLLRRSLPPDMSDLFVLLIILVISSFFIFNNIFSFLKNRRK